MQPSITPISRWFTAKRSLLLALGLLCFVLPIAQQWLIVGRHASAEALSYPIGLLMLGLLLGWVLLDARERSYQVSRFLSTTILLLAVIGIPYYLFATRGALSGSKAMLKLLGLTLLFFFCLILGGIVALVLTA